MIGKYLWHKWELDWEVYILFWLILDCGIGCFMVIETFGLNIFIFIIFFILAGYTIGWCVDYTVKDYRKFKQSQTEGGDSE